MSCVVCTCRKTFSDTYNEHVESAHLRKDEKFLYVYGVCRTVYNQQWVEEKQFKLRVIDLLLL